MEMAVVTTSKFKILVFFVKAFVYFVLKNDTVLSKHVHEVFH